MFVRQKGWYRVYFDFFLLQQHLICVVAGFMTIWDWKGVVTRRILYPSPHRKCPEYIMNNLIILLTDALVFPACSSFQKTWLSLSLPLTTVSGVPRHPHLQLGTRTDRSPPCRTVAPRHSTREPVLIKNRMSMNITYLLCRL